MQGSPAATELLQPADRPPKPSWKSIEAAIQAAATRHLTVLRLDGCKQMRVLHRPRAGSRDDTDPTRSPPPTLAIAAPPANARALLLARIYEILPLVCPQCGGEIRIIAFITDGPTVRLPSACAGRAGCKEGSFLVPDGRWHTYTANLAGNPDFVDKDFAGFKFSPSDKAFDAGDDGIEVDYIRVANLPSAADTDQFRLLSHPRQGRART